MGEEECADTNFHTQQLWRMLKSVVHGDCSIRIFDCLDLVLIVLAPPPLDPLLDNAWFIIKTLYFHECICKSRLWKLHFIASLLPIAADKWTDKVMGKVRKIQCWIDGTNKMI